MIDWPHWNIVYTTDVRRSWKMQMKCFQLYPTESREIISKTNLIIHTSISFLFKEEHCILFHVILFAYHTLINETSWRKRNNSVIKLCTVSLLRFFCLITYLQEIKRNGNETTTDLELQEKQNTFLPMDITDNIPSHDNEISAR